jgi:hypothetical protein
MPVPRRPWLSITSVVERYEQYDFNEHEHYIQVRQRPQYERTPKKRARDRGSGENNMIKWLQGYLPA